MICRPRRGCERLARPEVLEARVLLSGMPPTASNNSYNVTDDHLDTSADSVPGVLANDSDMESDPLTATLVSGPSHGSLTFNSNGHFVYTPNAGYLGSDSFTYKAWDGTSFSASNATVSLTVTSPFSSQTNSEDRPSAGADSYGPFSVIQQTGDVQAGRDVGDGHSLVYWSGSDPDPLVPVEMDYTHSGGSVPTRFEATLTSTAWPEPPSTTTPPPSRRAPTGCGSPSRPKPRACRAAATAGR
jgi:hypothetical protein